MMTKKEDQRWYVYVRPGEIYYFDSYDEAECFCKTYYPNDDIYPKPC